MRTVDAGEVRALAVQLSAVLAELDAGRMDGTPAIRARIQGAVVALGVVLGEDPTVIVDRLTATA